MRRIVLSAPLTRSLHLTLVLLLVGLFLAVPSLPGALAATTWTVNGVAGGPCTLATPVCTTIQAAVNAASAGDTINVLSGVYPEQVVITKNLTLTGAGPNSTSINPPHNFPFVPDADGSNEIVQIDGGATVTMSGFTVAGPVDAASAGVLVGIFVRGNATLNLSNSTIEHLRDPAVSGGQRGFGMRVGQQSLSQVGHATLSNVAITDYQKAGIVVDNVGSTATIMNTTVTGFGPHPLISQTGIQISRGAAATVSGNNVSGNECNFAGGGCSADPLNGVQALGILLFDANPTTTVSNNSVHDNDVGIYHLNSAGGSTLINGNTLANNRYEGIFLDQGTAAVNGNTVTGGNIGVEIVSFTGSTGNSSGTLTSNLITGAGIGIQLQDQPPLDAFIPTLTAHFNRIVGNPVAVNNTTTGSVDVTNNWWGCNAGPNASGCGPISGPASFTPWLILTVTAAPPSIPSGGSSTITADLVHNSAGADTSGAGAVPDGTPVGFTTDLGTLTVTNTVTTGGRATTSLTASAPGGSTATAHVSATVDSQTTAVAVTINGATLTPTSTATATATPTPTTTACILADINCDGIVDIRDYGIWRQNFGQTNCGNPADLNGDCIVDLSDYGIWRQNFGHTASASPGCGTTAGATDRHRHTNSRTDRNCHANSHAEPYAHEPLACEGARRSGEHTP